VTEAEDEAMAVVDGREFRGNIERRVRGTAEATQQGQCQRAAIWYSGDHQPRFHGYRTDGSLQQRVVECFGGVLRGQARRTRWLSSFSRTVTVWHCKEGTERRADASIN
jgi:hypothetical protein